MKKAVIQAHRDCWCRDGPDEEGSKGSQACGKGHIRQTKILQEALAEAVCLAQLMIIQHGAQQCQSFSDPRASFPLILVASASYTRATTWFYCQARRGTIAQGNQLSCPYSLLCTLLGHQSPCPCERLNIKVSFLWLKPTLRTIVKPL